MRYGFVIFYDNSFSNIEMSRRNGMNSIKKEKSLVPAGNQTVTPWSPSR